jgi:dTDP-4-dehydrorhamnose 3,5-epimerase
MPPRPTAQLGDFTPDQPWTANPDALAQIAMPDAIAGVTLHRLITHGDDRGDLTVLGSDLGLPGFAAPHVYLVTAAPGSIRAWVYHRWQDDRLAYTNGEFRIVLFDLRSDSPTSGQMMTINAGAANKVLLRIPAFVAHGVQNRSGETAYFVNMPTRAYDPDRPDKSRLPYGDPRLPYVFD